MEPIIERLCNDIADAFYGLQFPEISRGEFVYRTEGVRQQDRGLFAHMRYRKSDDKPVELCLARLFDGCDQFFCGKLREPFKFEHVALFESKDVVVILDQSLVEQKIDRLFSQADHIQTALPGEVIETAPYDRKRIPVDAAPGRLTRDALDAAVAAALRNSRRPLERPRILAAQLGQDLYDVGDNVACLLQNNRVADANIETLDLILVVE